MTHNATGLNRAIPFGAKCNLTVSPIKNNVKMYYFFLCLFFLKRFLRLWVAILCLFLFLPLGIGVKCF